MAVYARVAWVTSERTTPHQQNPKKNLVGLIRLRLDLSKLSHTYTT